MGIETISRIQSVLGEISASRPQLLYSGISCTMFPTPTIMVLSAVDVHAPIWVIVSGLTNTVVIYVCTYFQDLG